MSTLNQPTFWDNARRQWWSVEENRVQGHIVQSKIFAFLVPLTCTNACKSGTTRQPADGMYLWVWPTHPKLYSLYYNHDIVLVVGRQYKDIMVQLASTSCAITSITYIWYWPIMGNM